MVVVKKNSPNRYYGNVIPIIEWVCVAGIPNVLSSWITFCPTGTISINVVGSSNLLSVADGMLIFTAFLSLISLLRYGDNNSDDIIGTNTFCGTATTNRGVSENNITQDEYCNKNTQDTRGTGLVIGSHLIPLLYYAICANLIHRERLNISVNDLDPTLPNNYRHIELTVGYDFGRLRHLKFASLGGMAFAASILWLHFLQHNKLSLIERSNYTSEKSMKLCWKIYTILLLFDEAISAIRSRQNKSNGNFCGLFLGSLHVFLILCYNQRRSCGPLCDEISSGRNRGSWQDAFTPGEWMAVSTLIASLLGEFCLQYFDCFQYGKPSSILRDHLAVSHAGLVGCIVGITSSLLLQNFLLRNDGSPTIIKKVSSLIVVVGVILGCLEIAITPNFENLGQNSSIACSGNDLETFTTMTWKSLVCNENSPKSFLWLLSFLASSKKPGKSSLFRLSLLSYWVMVISICLPISLFLTRWIDGFAREKNLEGFDTKDKNRKRRVIIARKFFHLVAILLFSPITLLDPDLMAISYAIAVALLMVVELVRLCLSDVGESNRSEDEDYHSNSNIYWSTNTFYTAFLDEKDSAAAQGGLAITHMALIIGCAFPLWVHQLLEYDSMANVCESRIWSYLRLILPYLGILVLGVGDSMGAICGLKYGRHYWPGVSSRTLEGSLGMFLSMIFLVFMVIFFTSGGDSACAIDFARIAAVFAIPLGMSTLLEATTMQIDNLCLSIAASTITVLLEMLD